MTSSDDGYPEHGDDVVTTVADLDAARPLVEALLLAGLGPSVRETPAGLQVTVVEGQGERARQALGLAPAAPALPVSDTPPRRTGGLLAGATSASGPSPTSATPAPTRIGTDRSSTIRVVVIFAIALVAIPALAFYLSFRAAGG